MFNQDSDAPMAPPPPMPPPGMDPGADQSNGLSPEAAAIFGPDLVALLSDPEVAQAIVGDLREMLGLGDGDEDNEQGSADGFDQDAQLGAGDGQTPGGPMEAPTQPMPPVEYGNTPGGPQGGPSAMLSPDVPRQQGGPPSGLRQAGGGPRFGR